MNTTSKNSIFGNDAKSKYINTRRSHFKVNYSFIFFIDRQKHSVMSAVGHQMMQGGIGSMNSSKMSNGVNFYSFANDLEEEINETRKELNFLKKEINILNTEKDTIAEMASSKCDDIDRYLHKEISYLEELIGKSQVKQKAENSRF